TFGDSARESYGRMIAAVSRAESFIADARRTVVQAGTVAPTAHAADAVRHALRGALAKLAGAPGERGPILHQRASDSVLAFLARPDAEELTAIGCATPDHVIRTKPTPLFLRLPPPEGGKPLGVALEEQIV